MILSFTFFLRWMGIYVNEADMGRYSPVGIGLLHSTFHLMFPHLLL